MWDSNSRQIIWMGMGTEHNPSTRVVRCANAGSDPPDMAIWQRLRFARFKKCWVWECELGCRVQFSGHHKYLVKPRNEKGYSLNVSSSKGMKWPHTPASTYSCWFWYKWPGILQGFGREKIEWMEIAVCAWQPHVFKSRFECSLNWTNSPSDDLDTHFQSSSPSLLIKYLITHSKHQKVFVGPTNVIRDAAQLVRSEPQQRCHKCTSTDSSTDYTRWWHDLLLLMKKENIAAPKWVEWCRVSVTGERLDDIFFLGVKHWYEGICKLLSTPLLLRYETNTIVGWN